MKSDKMPKSYFVYILLTQNNTYYCGYTDNVEARFKKHIEGKASKYTRAFKPVKVVYSQEFATKSEAMKEEIRIKALTREQKEQLIKFFI